MLLRNPIPKVSLLILVSVPVYLFLISGQDRMADGGISGDEAYLAEKIYSVLPALSIFATLGLGLWRAFKAKRWGWFGLQAFVFPLAYVYTLMVDSGEGEVDRTRYVNRPVAKRYGVAVLMAGVMLLSGVGIGGAGHGWIPGAYGFFASTPVAFFAWLNLLSPRPSLRGAVVTLSLWLAVCVVVAVMTQHEGTRYFLGLWRTDYKGDMVLAALIYLNVLIASVAAMFRVRRHEDANP